MPKIPLNTTVFLDKTHKMEYISYRYVKKRYRINFQGGITMNKTEFVEAIANEAGLTKSDAAKAVKAFTDVVVKAMKDGDKVQLVGFGTFEATKRPARQGINPATKEKITIAAANVPKFKAGAALKKELN